MRFLFCLFLIFFFLTACKKESDTNSPDVNFIFPLENSFHNVFDTVFIQAEIQDETNLTKIEVGFTDENFTPVLRTFDIPFKSNPYKLFFDYPINDKFLESGDYYFLIKAYDDNNVKHKYQKIRLLELEKEYLGLIAICENSSDLEVKYLNQNNIISNKLSFSKDYSSMVFNPFNNSILIQGNKQNNLEVYSIDNFSLLWNVNNQNNPPFPYFTNAELINNKFFVAYYDGKIESFNADGSNYKNYTLSNGFYAYKSLLIDDILIFIEMNRQNQQQQIQLYYFTGSGLKNTFQTNYVTQDIYKKDINELFLFSNKNGNGEIRIYYINQNNTWLHKTMTDSIIDVVQMSSEEYYLISESALYFYKYSNSNLINVKSLVNATTLDYDEVNDRLIIAHDNGIEFFELPGLNTLNFVDFNSKVIDFEIHTNK